MFHIRRLKIILFGEILRLTFSHNVQAEQCAEQQKMLTFPKVGVRVNIYLSDDVRVRLRGLGT